MPHRDLGLFEAGCEILAQPAPPPNTWAKQLTREMQKLRARKIGALGLVLEIIESVGPTNLRKSGRIGAPNELAGSDHLPLFARLSVP